MLTVLCTVELCVTDVHPFELYKLCTNYFFYAQSAKLDGKVNVNLHHLHTVKVYSSCTAEVHAF